MTLKQLAREVQEYVIDGVAALIIWKKGRSWNYINSWYIAGISDDEEKAEYEAIIEKVKSIDKNFIELYTYECFLNNTQDYIAFQIKNFYEGYKANAEKAITKEEIKEEIDESVDVEITLTDEEAMFLSEFAANHYEGSKENLATMKPLFLVQTQTERPAYENEEPDRVEYIVHDWAGEVYNSLKEIAEEYWKGRCPIKIVNFDDLHGCENFIAVNGETTEIYDMYDYIRAYEIEFEIEKRGYCCEYETKAYFFIKEEAKRYLKYQEHNLKSPRIYAVDCGYCNKGEYIPFYDLLLRLGFMINEKDGFDYGNRLCHCYYNNRHMDCSKEKDTWEEKTR